VLADDHEQGHGDAHHSGDEMTRPNRPTLAAVNKLLRSLTLDERGEVLAAIAKQLAKQLDESTATTGAALSKELSRILGEIVDPNDTRGKDLLTWILTGREP